MNGFIEVTTKYGKRFINVNFIVAILPCGDGCNIFFENCAPGYDSQNYLNIYEKYEEVKNMILNANIKTCNCAIRSEM